jgi:thioredoxin reductase
MLILPSFHNPFAQGYQNSTSVGHSGVLAVDWIAMPKFALHLTHLLLQLTPTVTIYTHGNPDLGTTLAPLLQEFKNEEGVSNVNIDNRTISRLVLSRKDAEDQVVIDVFFTDGTQTTEAFLGHAATTKLNDSFAEQLSIDVSPSGAEYTVNGPTNATVVKGIYAAGDATNMLKVWPNAVASGAVTAAGVAVSLQEEKWGLPPIFG